MLAAFLSLVLLSKKRKSVADKILLAWLITITCTLVLFELQTEGHRSGYPYLLGWSFPLPLAQWPFLYLYVRTLTSKKTFQPWQLLHFFPVLMSVVLFSGYLALPNQLKLEIYNQQGAGYELEMAINLGAILLSALVYTACSVVVLMRYHQAIKQEFSSTDKVTLNWLLYLTLGMTSILLFVLFGASDAVVYSSITGLVLCIGYFGIKQVGVFYATAEPNSSVEPVPFAQPTAAIHEAEVPEGGSVRAKYDKNKLSEEVVSSIHQLLTELMHEEKPYKNSELTLSELAKRLDVPPNTLSQVINRVEQKNFYEYINAHRVAEFQNLVLQPGSGQYTLLGLAFESGFNSKTSFNRNFKKVTGDAPSDYLKRFSIHLEG